MSTRIEHPALSAPDRPTFTRFVAALARVADRVSAAIVGANDTDPRCPS